jgi:hypothetical protein
MITAFPCMELLLQELPSAYSSLKDCDQNKRFRLLPYETLLPTGQHPAARATINIAHTGTKYFQLNFQIDL